MNSYRVLVDDIVRGFFRIPLAIALAREDLKDRYRRSVFGITWIIISFVAFIAVKALVFGSMFSAEDYNYFSHLVIGFALFGFISSVVTGSVNLYVSNKTWVLSSNLPYTLYAHALITRNFIELFILLAVAGILIFFAGSINFEGAWTIIPAIILYYVTAFGLCLALSPLGARLRDLVYAIQTMMRIVFFATPIIWVAQPGTMQETIARWNPLTYYIDIIRKPFVEGVIPHQSWTIVLIMTSVILLIGLVVSGHTRKAITRWV